jgi:hypothetical protein
MKVFVLTLACAAMILTAGTAHAGNVMLTRLLNATTSDFKTITSSFISAREDGTLSWEDYRKKIGETMARIAARREVLEDFERRGAKTMPAGERALVRMMARDLAGINLSLLALVCDGRGYAGYLRTGDEELIKGIVDWQMGIRQAIGQTRRCIKMAGEITFPLMRPRLRAVPAR